LLELDDQGGIMKIYFDNSYTSLPESCYAHVRPTPVKSPELLLFNSNLAKNLGIETTSDTETASVLCGNKILESSVPLAMAYAGHQFGNFVPLLGDGRAILLGEVLNQNQERFDIQLKGSGITPFSRRGDGRAALGPMLREYIVSEAMNNLRIKTTRSLALVATGENVLRENEYPGAILTRVASSHIRIGTFQYFAAQSEFKTLKILADYTIKRHYPNAAHSKTPYLAFLKEVLLKQASLLADWMAVGFIHGVINTDNVTISGETIDYGPCAFMDHYSDNMVFSSIDQFGRYSFNNQPYVGLWNFLRFAESIAFLINRDFQKSTNAIVELGESFFETYQKCYLNKMALKIGITDPSSDDLKLIENLFEVMNQNSLDFTLTFRHLSSLHGQREESIYSSIHDLSCLSPWISQWQKRLIEQSIDLSVISQQMQAINPAIIPRNHQIEVAIVSAVQSHDLTAAKQLILALSTPFDERREHLNYMLPPLPHQVVHKTFCGT
jgi:uncharacterized protein YdiU (UPF0061 family)